MAGKSLQDILGWVALTRAVNAVKDGIPNPLPKFFFKVAAENKVVGNSTKYNRTYGSRKTARTIKWGAAPRHRELQQEELVEQKFLSFSEERQFDPYVLQTLRDYDSYDNSEKAKRLVANNVKTLGTLFGNSRIVAVATTLCKGNVYDDGVGNLLPSSSGAVNTYGQQVPSGNIGTITDEAGTNIFGATGAGSWALPSTDIPLQIARLQQAAALTHGYEPKIAFYGKNVRSYLIQNDYVLDYMARNSPMQTEYLQDNTIPNGLFGMQWVPAWKLGYTKDDGTKTAIWPADGVTFTPGEEDLDAYYSLFEGSNLIPTTIDIIPDAMAAMDSLTTVHGAAGYSVVSHKPVALSTIMVDTFWPALKIPEAVYIADVVA